ncbi:tRNA adenosine(34) deaminase TadA [Xylanivirga thermophila]|uniref:tRNA adenosine(34) deaminase TadA n=1 Tax=Xylanivirga thermophila TaxID=2496273 RepID=UPI00101D7BFE|nr:tRNA adenosine(34) deaminase TadA [Xylanivirga thermophila]
MLHEDFMRQAIYEAQKAYSRDEVPIGAVVVKDGLVIGRGYNLRESHQDPTLHAEIIAIREASKNLKSWRLTGCSLYVTIEPCAMCAGAMIQSRLENLIFGAWDPKGGCVGSLYDLVTDNRFNHRVEVIQGILEDECRELMQNFFRQKRLRRG